MTGRLLVPQHNALPFATPTAVSAPYWAGVAVGELRYQVCTFCQTVNVPPAEVCRECQLAGLRWLTSAGRGSVYSWTVVHRPPTPAFEELPYAPAIVDLDEGFQIVTNLIDILPEEITAGMAVEVEVHQVCGELYLPYFRPVTEVN